MGSMHFEDYCVIDQDISSQKFVLIYCYFLLELPVKLFAFRIIRDTIGDSALPKTINVGISDILSVLKNLNVFFDHLLNPWDFL